MDLYRPRENNVRPGARSNRMHNTANAESSK
jgi:hypothetical protein